jgi:hypothetical protein
MCKKAMRTGKYCAEAPYRPFGIDFRRCAACQAELNEELRKEREQKKLEEEQKKLAEEEEKTRKKMKDLKLQ